MNYLFASRNMAVALLGLFALTKPPSMTGCIFNITSFWIVNVVIQLVEFTGYFWMKNADMYPLLSDTTVAMSW